MQANRALCLAVVLLAACGQMPSQPQSDPPHPAAQSAAIGADGYGLTAATTNLVTNGDFETGTFSGWTKVSYNFIVTSPVHSGTYAAQVGSKYGIYNADMNISQSVAIPAAGATLSFFWYPVCWDTIQYDWQTVEIRDASTNATLATVFKVCDNTRAWKQVTYDLTPFAGKTIKLWFNDHDDGYSSTDETYFYLDDVAVTPNAAAASDFSLSVSPASQNVAPGGSVAYTVTTAVTSGSAQSVSLAVSGLPAGVTGSFNPASVSAGATSTLTLTAASSAAAATSTFTVTGTGSAATHTATASVSVTAPAANDFSVSVSPSSQTVAPGGSTSYTVATAVTSGSAQTISLSAAGLPAGVTGSFNPAQVTAGASSTLTLAAAGTAAAGSTTFTVTGAASSGSHSASATVTVSSASTGVGSNGGSVDHLYFAVVGDTRPGTLDDTANYPTAVITKIYQDVQALNPRPQFVVGTGDYMFASTTGTQAQPQMNLYLQAKQNYTGTVFASIGNHECDGYTADNCTPGQTTNYNVFFNGLVQPLGKTDTYYTININGTDGSWTSKLIVIACNVWSTTQKTWLQNELAKPTTYTLLARHEPAGSTTGPCVNDVQTLMTQYPYNLSLVGHVHDFKVNGKEVTVGTGGAPISTSAPFGYATVEKVATGWQIKQYDYSSALPINTYVVP